MIKIIPIGTEVEVNNAFNGIILSASIRKTTVVYEVQQTNEDGINTIWANEWEITSKHKETSVISQCLARDK